MRKEIIISYALLLIFVVLSIIRKNYEFLFYASTLIIFILVIQISDKKIHYNKIGLWGFNAWLLAHLLGGLATIKGVRLYDLMIFNLVGDPYNILKYDQVIHFFCYVVIGILMHDVMKTLVTKDADKTTLWIVTVLAASSVGALNEVIEFISVIFLNAADAVGGYTNTAIDMVANLLGAITSTFFYKWLK